MGRPRIAQLTSRIPRVEHLPTQLFLGYLPFSRWVVNLSYPPMCLYNCVYIMLVVSSPCFYMCLVVFQCFSFLHSPSPWKCRTEKCQQSTFSKCQPVVFRIFLLTNGRHHIDLDSRSQIHQHLKNCMFLQLKMILNDTDEQWQQVVFLFIYPLSNSFCGH